MGQCKKCGNELNNSQKFCSKCGETNDEYVEGAKFEGTNTKEDNNKGNNKKKFIIIGAVAVIAIIVVVAIVLINGGDDDKSSSKKGVNFKKIYQQIDGDGYYVTLASDNSYLKVDTNPLDLDDYSSSEAWDMIEQINEELDLPESVEEKMLHTRSIDGRVTQEFDDVTVSWTYHPDKGIEVLYEKN